MESAECGAIACLSEQLQKMDAFETNTPNFNGTPLHGYLAHFNLYKIWSFYFIPATL
jgi:hypothetical protein